MKSWRMVTSTNKSTLSSQPDVADCVCVYYCRTYYKAVRGGGRRRVDDMCYDRRRAEACVDEYSVFSIMSPLKFTTVHT